MLRFAQQFVTGSIVGCITTLFAWLFLENIRDAGPDTVVGLVGAMGVVVAALLTHRNTQLREIAARHFSGKKEGYQAFLDLLYDLMLGQKTGKKVTEAEMLKKISPFKKTIIYWADTDLIDAWDAYEKSTAAPGDTGHMMMELEYLLRAVRKDLGHNDVNLEFGKLATLFIIAGEKKTVQKQIQFERTQDSGSRRFL